jgi:DNA-binding MarR family transcriptional regulator
MSLSSINNRNQVYRGMNVTPAQWRIVQHLERSGASTRHELADALAMPLSGVCGRVNELEMCGLVVSTAETRETQYGKTATVVRLAVEQVRQMSLFE